MSDLLSYHNPSQISRCTLFPCSQLKKQALKEKIEDDVGALVQFLLDEKDRLLERLEAEEAATIALIDENLKLVESEAAKVDKAIAEIQNQLSEVANFEVCLTSLGFVCTHT